MNIAFNADDQLIETARERTRSEIKTLNDLFQRWLEDYSNKQVQ